MEKQTVTQTENASRKVILIVVDGFRPDAMTGCGHPYGNRLLELGSYSLEAETVFPSVTLPCHMSLFHSVPPERHGILTNTYVPQVRPVRGLCEQLSAAGRICSFFYNWEELRDLSRPSSLAYSFFVSESLYPGEKTNELVTENALSYIREESPDFAFVYLGLVDIAGHNHGWMSEEYMQACRLSLDEIQRLVEAFGDEYSIIVTADHGGHGWMHGTEEREDMLIPLVCIGPDFQPGARLGKAGICDIAPTVTELLGVTASEDWKGRSLMKNSGLSKDTV